MSYNPRSAVVPEMNVYTYYLDNGIRMVKFGTGDCIDIARQHRIPGDTIQGCRPGDDHSRRWDPEARRWEYMYLEFA